MRAVRARKKAGCAFRPVAPANFNLQHVQEPQQRLERIEDVLDGIMEGLHRRSGAYPNDAEPDIHVRGVVRCQNINIIAGPYPQGSVKIVTRRRCQTFAKQGTVMLKQSKA